MNLQKLVLKVTNSELYEMGKDLYVVKKCKDCPHWGKFFTLPEGLPPEAAQDLKDTHRECNNENSPVMLSPESFACIHSMDDYLIEGEKK